jgi:hypothetical protein
MRCESAFGYCEEDQRRDSVVNWVREAPGSHTEKVTGSDGLGDIDVSHLKVLHKVDDRGVQGESLAIGKAVFLSCRIASVSAVINFEFEAILRYVYRIRFTSSQAMVGMIGIPHP